MHEPPDISKYSSTKNSPLVEPKNILIKRIDNERFEKVSPFIIKNTIDFAGGGEVYSWKKTRVGCLLVKTKNSLQALKLLKITKMTNIELTASEYKTLYFTKGVIYYCTTRYETFAKAKSCKNSKTKRHARLKKL